MALAGGFVEEDCGCCGGVKGFDAAGHGDANSGIGAAFDFFRQAGAFVADKESNRFAPIHFPGCEDATFAVVRLVHAGCERAYMGDFQLREKNWQRHSGKNREMKRRAGGGAQGFRRKRAGGAGLAGSGCDRAGGAEGRSGTQDRADVSRVLDACENYKQRSAGRRGCA